MNIRQAIQRPVSHTALVAITILGVVRDGAEWPYDVAEASRISLSTVMRTAPRLVARGLLFALDGEAWAVSYEGALLLQRCGWTPRKG